MIETQIRIDLVTAMKAKDKTKILTLKSLTTTIDRQKIDNSLNREEALPDDAVTKLLRTEHKRRNEAKAAYEAGAREDLAATEAAEADIIQVYLPQNLSEEEIQTIVDAAVAEHGIDNMGILMKTVMGKTAGRADGKVIKELIENKL